MTIARGLRFAIPLLFLLPPVLAPAFDDPTLPDNPKTLKQQGSLVSVQIVFGEPIRFFVVGREEAKIDMKDLKLTVRQIEPYAGKVLQLSRENEYFVAVDSADLKDATALEVTARTKTKTDKVQFKIDRRRP